MNRFLAFLSLALCSVCFAQAPQLKSGSTVYLAPMDGYETAMAAAFVKKHVPLIVVADKDKADYIIQSAVAHEVPSTPQVVVNSSNVNNTVVNSRNVNNGSNDTWEQSKERAAARAAARAALGSTSANISMIDVHSSQVVFAYSVDKHGTTHQSQSAAEACAKHLKEFIEKPRR